jgi:hypothetical protein
MRKVFSFTFSLGTQTTTKPGVHHHGEETQGTSGGFGEGRLPGQLQEARDLVTASNTLTTAIKANPQFGTQPAMQQAVTTMSGITDTLSKQETDIQTSRTNLTAQLAARALTMHSFSRARRSLLAVADQIAAGSAATLNEWGFGAFSTQTPMVTTDAAPTGLRVRYTKDFALEILWKSVPGHRGYTLQIGDGTPTGWGTAIQSPKARYTPTGLTPGQKIAIRVAVQRKTGVSAYSEAITATVR